MGEAGQAGRFTLHSMYYRSGEKHDEEMCARRRQMSQLRIAFQLWRDFRSQVLCFIGKIQN